MRRALLSLVLALAATLAGAAEPPGAEALFAAKLLTPHGVAASLAASRGRPMIVNFWARWCTPCREEIPELVRAHEARRGVDIVGIDIGEEPAAVREFMRAYEMSYRVLVARDDGLELLVALGNPHANLPYTLAIDRRGRIVGRRLGVLTRAHLDALLESLR